MQFLEPIKWSMVVMDGKRWVAKARKLGCGGWMLTLNAACWADAMINEPRIKQNKRMGLSLQSGLNIKLVDTKAQARKILKEVAYAK